MPPGFTVSTLWTAISLVTMRETVTLWPDLSVPEDGDAVTLPSRLDDSKIDHVTGPPDAVNVRLPPLPGVSRILVGDTLSVPCAGGGGALVVLVDVLGTGEVGLGLTLVGAGVDGEGCLPPPGELGPVDAAPLEGAPPPEAPPPPDDGAPPATGGGDTCTTPFAETVGCGALRGLPNVGPAAVGPAAPKLVPGPGPGPRAAALRPL
jgi:hypothetical protein